MCILGVICNRFYFGKVQEKFLGHWSRLGKSLCKYSIEVSSFVLEFLEKLSRS